MANLVHEVSVVIPYVPGMSARDRALIRDIRDYTRGALKNVLNAARRDLRQAAPRRSKSTLQRSIQVRSRRPPKGGGVAVAVTARKFYASFTNSMDVNQGWWDRVMRTHESELSKIQRRAIQASMGTVLRARFFNFFGSRLLFFFLGPFAALARNIYRAAVSYRLANQT